MIFTRMIAGAAGAAALMLGASAGAQDAPVIDRDGEARGVAQAVMAAELARWVREPDRMCFAQVADTFYAWYAAQADAVRALSEALPVICSGVALGQVFKGTLKPDPALALFDGLNRGALPAAELDDEETLRFLRRQDIAAGGLAEGMNLVCSRGRALGFAKRIGARVNNLYPNSLRIIKQ